VVGALVGLIASTPDPDARAAAVRRLARLCRSGAITLLPWERTLLGAEAVRQIDST
jgi:hypothetical protein